MLYIANISKAMIDLPIIAFAAVGYRGGQSEIVSLIKVKDQCRDHMDDKCNQCDDFLCPVCIINGSQEECYRCWKKNGNYLSNNKNKYEWNVSLKFVNVSNFKYYKFSLIIKNIDYLDRGEYNCAIGTLNMESTTFSSNTVDFQVKG